MHRHRRESRNIVSKSASIRRSVGPGFGSFAAAIGSTSKTVETNDAWLTDDRYEQAEIETDLTDREECRADGEIAPDNLPSHRIHLAQQGIANAPANQPFDLLHGQGQARSGLAARRRPARFRPPAALPGPPSVRHGRLRRTLPRPVEAAEAQAGGVTCEQSADDAALDPRRSMGDAPGFGERRRHVHHQNSPGSRGLHRVTSMLQASVQRLRRGPRTAWPRPGRWSGQQFVRCGALLLLRQSCRCLRRKVDRFCNLSGAVRPARKAPLGQDLLLHRRTDGGIVGQAQHLATPGDEVVRIEMETEPLSGFRERRRVRGDEGLAIGQAFRERQTPPLIPGR